jgi:hypothetical protein
LHRSLREIRETMAGIGFVAVLLMLFVAVTGGDEQ